ncbi:MAG: AAA family ATPase [Acidobacteriota bacterium]
MLTRIEINGFKSFEDFELDLAPLTVILGSNSAGKSNLFDALLFLSALTEGNLQQAAARSRGELHELFGRDAEGGAVGEMSFAVEVLLPGQVKDPWGNQRDLQWTRLRYEVRLRRRSDAQGLERVQVVHELARALLKTEDRERLTKAFCVSKEFSADYLRYGRSRVPFLRTGPDEMTGIITFELSQDGKQGRKRRGVAGDVLALASAENTEFAHLFALREELRNLRLLHINPAEIRKPVDPLDRGALKVDASNLASVLDRIETESRTNDQEGILQELSLDLAVVIPMVRDVRVTKAEDGRKNQVLFQLKDGLEVPAALASDGTLRLLALLTYLRDPEYSGVLCLEEPENGIHPGRLRELIPLLRDLVVDPAMVERPAHPLPLTQLLLNSHSPVVLAALHGFFKEEIKPPVRAYFAQMVPLFPGASELSPLGRRGRTKMVPLEFPLQLGMGAVEDGDGRPSSMTDLQASQFLAAADAGI